MKSEGRKRRYGKNLTKKGRKKKKKKGRKGSGLVSPSARQKEEKDGLRGGAKVT